MKLTRVDLPSSKGEEERQLVKLHSFQGAKHISTHWITTWTCSINFLTFLVCLPTPRSGQQKNDTVVVYLGILKQALDKILNYDRFSKSRMKMTTRTHSVECKPPACRELHMNLTLLMTCSHTQRNNVFKIWHKIGKEVDIFTWTLMWPWPWCVTLTLLMTCSHIQRINKLK